jgi:hypothetical protein
MAWIQIAILLGIQAMDYRPWTMDYEKQLYSIRLPKHPGYGLLTMDYKKQLYSIRLPMHPGYGL